jgi:uncharacterized protein (UPF0335 family)
MFAEDIPALLNNVFKNEVAESESVYSEGENSFPIAIYVVEFASKLIKLLIEKKQIDETIKELKTEYKEDGVPANIVTKCINLIKSKKKKSESELFELDIIQGWLESDKNIEIDIATLIAK